MPLVAIFGTDLNQVRISMIIGTMNVVLMWLILGKLSLKPIIRLLLILGFAFGTVHFYAAITGTTWFFAHIMAVFFLSLAILERFGKSRPLILGFLVGLAFLSREPTILSVPFFAWPFFKKRRFDALIYFSVGILPLLFFQGFYNHFRFNDIFEMGYIFVYQRAVANSSLQYSLSRIWWPDLAAFGQFDIRNIPLHFYTIFLMLPKFSPAWPFLFPSPYGLSVILTSPFLIYSIFSKNNLSKPCWITILLISIPIFLHFTQGWIQFGYRFILDFLPFLLILTALGFFHKGSLRLKTILVMFSIVVNVWGNWWARTLGW